MRSEWKIVNRAGPPYIRAIETQQLFAQAFIAKREEAGYLALLVAVVSAQRLTADVSGLELKPASETLVDLDL